MSAIGKENKKIIWNIIEKERDRLKLNKQVEFEYGKKRFILKRVK